MQITSLLLILCLRWVGYLQQIPSAKKLISEVVALANRSVVATVVLGLIEEWKSEGYDKKSMAFPGSQDELVKALISSVQRPESLIFVDQSGSPVELPWIDKVSTFLQAWYGGQEAGNALADVLLGNTNLSGRLPITWPWRCDGRIARYKEDTQVGYRWYNHHPDVLPLWGFGYGLSYTLFSSNVTNVTTWGLTGQINHTLIVGFENAPVLRPNEDITINIQVRKRDAAHWKGDKWVLGKGRYAFGLGNGVKEAMKTSLEIKVESHTWSSCE
ncbi:Glycoside hydrolase family 3 [Penicillium italicum]|uniref:beta-glucosidase n=1 Tax=Penicillium italicum TaxID=40296 RepID=A0A0A2LBZ0_PENIT|nr:Glycoside hydrolase family 3 [Penicillium italicum]